MDPATLETILQVGIGALGTALVGIVSAVFGAWLQSQREHSRWLREERLVAYRRFMGDGDFLNVGIERAGEAVHLTPESKRAALEAITAMGLLGPATVYAAAVRYQDAAHNLIEGSPDDGRPSTREIEALRNRLGELMQAELGVPRRERFGARRPPS